MTDDRHRVLSALAANEHVAGKPGYARDITPSFVWNFIRECGQDIAYGTVQIVLEDLENERLAQGAPAPLGRSERQYHITEHGRYLLLA